jgi:hypothetical protein
MRPAALHAALSIPIMLALLAPNEEARLQGWYVGECLVIVLLLVDRWRERDAASLLVIAFGVFVQVLAVGCSYWGEGGACDAPTGLPVVGVSVLIGVGIVAEVIAWRGRRVGKRG